MRRQVVATTREHDLEVVITLREQREHGTHPDLEADPHTPDGLVEALLAAAPRTRWLRDPTRGGVGTVCNELARYADLTVVLAESSTSISSGRVSGDT